MTKKRGLTDGERWRIIDHDDRIRSLTTHTYPIPSHPILCIEKEDVYSVLHDQLIHDSLSTYPSCFAPWRNEEMNKKMDRWLAGKELPPSSFVCMIQEQIQQTLFSTAIPHYLITGHNKKEVCTFTVSLSRGNNNTPSSFWYLTDVLYAPSKCQTVPGSPVLMGEEG